MPTARPRYFRNKKLFRLWLEKNHHTTLELWVGFHKKHTGKTSIDWPQSVDAALCYGWIDGLRRSIDADSYMIRFTPRKPRSHWSLVNIRRYKELQREGLVESAGKSAFAKRDKHNTGRASHEQAGAELTPEFLAQLKADRNAWQYYSQLQPAKIKNCNWWVMSAKQEATRRRRLGILIDCSARGELIPPLVWTKPLP